MGIVIEIVFVIAVLFVLFMNVIMLYAHHLFKDEENLTKLTGFEIAKKVSNKLTNEEPYIIKKKGNYLDHYNWNRNTIKLSREVFDGTNIYASVIALGVALETDPQKIKVVKGHKLSSFLVLVSYAMFVVCSFLINANIMYFGMILFILAVLLELFMLNLFGKTSEEHDKLLKQIGVNKLIKTDIADVNTLSAFGLILGIARIPYGFINYFR